MLKCVLLNFYLCFQSELHFYHADTTVSSNSQQEKQINIHIFQKECLTIPVIKFLSYHDSVIFFPQLVFVEFAAELKSTIALMIELYRSSGL